MKKVILIVSSALVLFAAPSCKREKCISPSSGYLIFGRFYGECMGEECIEIFKLEQNQLFEDTRDAYPGSTDFYAAAYTLLPQQKFDEAKDLINFFPSDLLSESVNVIGHPDAGDWGGLYIEYNYNGTRKFWLLDKAKVNVPSKYHAFIDKVNEKIDLIQSR
jgi:hypothetical protein